MSVKSFLAIAFVIIACRSVGQYNSRKGNPSLQYSKYNIEYATELSELGLTKMAAKSNPFWNIEGLDLNGIDSAMKDAISLYLKEKTYAEKDTLFIMNDVHRQYSGFYDSYNEKMLLVRFYSKNKLKSQFGDSYADTLRVHRASYYHMYPHFYFLVYSLKNHNVVYMKW